MDETPQEGNVTHSDGITDHIRAREEEHFRKKDRELIEKLRRADAEAKARRALEQETGLHDPAMLEELSHLGFTPETIALLPLVPVLQVAWAEDGVSAAERALITSLARARGIAEGSASDRQLREWLEYRPSDDTFHKATRLIAAIVDSPEGGAFHVTADELIGYCDKIAHASGGIFGIGRVSPHERAALAEIAATIKRR
jgi:ADP-ribose pyrophosphatase YjhB (NUDIX family)